MGRKAASKTSRQGRESSEMTEELIDLSKPGQHYKNMCPRCKRLNTIWPILRGRRKIYICMACNTAVKGVEPTSEAWKDPVQYFFGKPI